MSAAAWLTEFLKQHRRNHAPPDWPANEAEMQAFLDGFVHHFDANHVTQQEAYQASTDLMASPPRWRNEHIPKLLERVRARRDPATISARPEETDVSNAEFDRKAQANWNRLDREERDEWRRRCLAHYPFLSLDKPQPLELMAMGWAFVGSIPYEGEPVPKYAGNSMSPARKTLGGLKQIGRSPDVALGPDGRLVTLAEGRLPASYAE